MSDIKLSAPKVRVLMADGSIFDDLQTVNYDMMRYEETGRRQTPKWGGPAENPITFASFIAWSAATRKGLTAMAWDQWKVEAEDISVIDDEDGNPTEPGPVPGS